MTRIGGSYWNFNGYTRIQLSSTSSSASQTTLNDLLNRTYHVSLTYDNPQSKWILGFGRMYLPWAPSLSTIDGGYLARRLSKRFTVGMFAGTTPDPTSWNYSPNRQEAGTFVNFEGGSWDGFTYGSTTGFGISRLSWHPESEFAVLREHPVVEALLQRVSQPAGRPVAPHHPAAHRRRQGTGAQFSDRTVRTGEISLLRPQRQLLPQLSDFRPAAGGHRSTRQAPVPGSQRRRSSQPAVPQQFLFHRG